MTFVRFLLALLGAYLVHLLGLLVSPRFPSLVDPFLLVAIWFAFRTGPAGAQIVGTIAGLLQDGLSGGLYGLYAFANTLVCYGVSLAAQRVVIGQQAVRVLIFALATALQQAVLALLLLAMLPDPPLPSVGAVVGKVLIHSVLGAILIGLESQARAQWGSFQRRRASQLRFH